MGRFRRDCAFWNGLGCAWTRRGGGEGLPRSAGIGSGVGTAQRAEKRSLAGARIRNGPGRGVGERRSGSGRCAPGRVRTAGLGNGLRSERPSAPKSEVWRERAFETVLDEAWVSGVLDRAVVRRDASGQPVSATVYDFKTDILSEDADLAMEAARYGAQLHLYRRAVAALTGLNSEAVGCEVVFTRLRRAVRIPV